jgi:hypothetical protein
VRSLVEFLEKPPYFSSNYDKMNDALIRESFHRQVLRRHHTSPGTLVVDELGLKHGKCRADIAIINGALTGYEIKSDKDSLGRLTEQVRIYGAVFDRATVIAGAKHRAGVVSLLPKWWGVIVCHQGTRGGIRFETWRTADLNRSVDSIAIAQLLWKTEAVEMLQSLGEPSSITRLSRSVLYEQLAQAMELDELQRRVREALKVRKNWRHPAPLFPDGD